MNKSFLKKGRNKEEFRVEQVGFVTDAMKEVT